MFIGLKNESTSYATLGITNKLVIMLNNFGKFDKP